ncbi:MAG: metal-sensing transcriptional repressor, partial [Clostridium sp.]
MEKAKKDIITRLRRIEGQVKGIQKMIENGSDCT